MKKEAMWGINLKFCRIVSNVSLYKNILFIAVAKALCLLWQLKVSIDLQWEKLKLRFIALIADILTKVLQKCLLSGSPPSIPF